MMQRAAQASENSALNPDRTLARTITIPYTRPFDWPAMIGFYRMRAIDGVERIGPAAYCRSVAINEGVGWLTVRDEAEAGMLVATLESTGAVHADDVATRLRQMFDTDADLGAVQRHFEQDPSLAPLLAARQVVRIPGHWDPFETAIRAVLGQQVTVLAARRLASRLVERAGRLVGDPDGDKPFRMFPSPHDVLRADLSAMGMPGARTRTLRNVAAATLADPQLFGRGRTLDETVARLVRIEGVGSWTAQYVALRACREPDAFPASDVGLVRGMAEHGRRPTPAELLARSEAWRPFRAYAAQLIWAAPDAFPPVKRSRSHRLSG